MDNNKVIVSVAPVAHVGTTLPSGVENPLTPQEVASETIRCVRAGASMVHLHVRDRQGEQTFDLSEYSATIDLIRDEVDIIVQGSTGGLSTLSLSERCVSVAEPRTEIASLNMGSTNFGESVYINTLEDIRYWAAEMKRHGVVPELEVFTVGMLASIDRLVAEGTLSRPLRYNFCLGFPGALLGDVRHIAYLASLLPADAHWGLIHEGMKDFRLLATALSFGARTVRVGFEDGPYLAPGQPASTNAVLVERLVELVRLLGFEPATPEEARSMLAISGP